MSRKIKEIILSILSSRRKLTYLILITTLIIVIPVLATYTGPDRTVQEKQCHTEKVITGCYYTMPAEDELHLNCKVASTYPGCPHPAAGFFAGCDGNSQLHYIQEDQEVCVWVDVPAPPATVSGNVFCTNGSNGWCRSDALLNINGADPNPANSIIAIEGTRNGTDFVCAGNTCQIDATGNGTYAFEYWAVSSHGDTSYKENTTISVDKESPEINLSVSGSMGYNNWYVSNVNWSTTVTDNISGPSHADITVDGSAQANPGSYGADGTHTIQATGYDIAGNNVQTQQTFSIDQTNPIPAYALSGSLGSNNWYISDVAWTGTATDATSGINAIQVQVDGGVVNNPASIAANGSHTIQVTAQDLAGNIASTSGSFQIDQEMPALNLNLSGTAGKNGWYISPVSWTSSTSDAVSGLSSHTLTLNSAPTTADGNTSSDGIYTLNAIAQDNASNQTTQTKNFGIDQTAPTVSFSPLSGTYSDSVALSGSSTDDTSGVAYIEIQVAGQTHQVPATGDWSLNWNTKSTCNGDVTATVRAFDQAGHASAPQSQSFTIHNQSVKITLPSQIDASQPVPLGINPSNISRMTVRITDDAGKLPAISQTYTGASIPSNYQWDRYMGDGSLAPKGTYTLNVLIQDKNTCVEDAASITLVVSDSKFSAWVSGAPTNTPAPIYPTFTPLPSPTPTLESTTTQPAIAANTSAPSATEAPTNTPTPVVIAFLSPKAEQKTTTTTNDSPKAPVSTSGATTDDTASTLPTGTLIGSAAAGLIGSIAAYQAAKEAERKRREEEARKRAKELQHLRSYLQKNGEDWHGLGMDQMREKVQETKIKVEQERIYAEQQRAAEIAQLEAIAAYEAKKEAEQAVYIKQINNKYGGVLSDETINTYAQALSYGIITIEEVIQQANEIVDEMQLGLASVSYIDEKSKDYADKLKQELGNEKINIHQIPEYWYAVESGKINNSKNINQNDEFYISPAQAEILMEDFVNMINNIEGIEDQKNIINMYENTIQLLRDADTIINNTSDISVRSILEAEEALNDARKIMENLSTNPNLDPSLFSSSINEVIENVNKSVKFIENTNIDENLEIINKMSKNSQQIISLGKIVDAGTIITPLDIVFSLVGEAEHFGDEEYEGWENAQKIVSGSVSDIIIGAFVGESAAIAGGVIAGGIALLFGVATAPAWLTFVSVAAVAAILTGLVNEMNITENFENNINDIAKSIVNIFKGK